MQSVAALTGYGSLGGANASSGVVVAQKEIKVDRDSNRTRFADFPVAPFLIGYVLSAQLEYRLGQAVIYKGDMPLTEYLFNAPVALVLFAVSACLLLAPMLRPLWAGRRK